MISELQRQLSELDTSSSSGSSLEQQQEQGEQVVLRSVRKNPFNKDNEVPVTNNNHFNNNNNIRQVPLRKAPPPPTPPIVRDTTIINPFDDDNELSMKSIKSDNDDFNFLFVHEYFGKSWKKHAKERQDAKEKSEQPLIVF